jgi:hypothetical protein
MPLHLSRARLAAGLAALAASVACAVGAAPASAGVLNVSLTGAQAKSAWNVVDCTPGTTFTQPFAPWGDGNDYAMAPGGDFESLSGWTGLGAGTVEDQEPWLIGSATDHRALRIPAGVTATSPYMCIDATYPFFRFFARNTGDQKATLAVAVQYLTRSGKVVTSDAGTVRATGAGWFVTPPLKIAVQFGDEPDASAPVVFRFTSAKGGDWRMDDLYIDPFARR